MAQTVLIGVCAGIPSDKEEEHDLESLCWVILCAVYKHGLTDTETLEKVPIESFREKFTEEHDMLFGARSMEDLLRERTVVFETRTLTPVHRDGNYYYVSDVRAGVASLFAYATQVDRGDGDLEGDLKGLLGVVWKYILAFRPQQVDVFDDDVDVLYQTVAFGEEPVWDEVSLPEPTHRDLLTILNVALARISSRRIKREEGREEARMGVEAAQKMHD